MLIGAAAAAGAGGLGDCGGVVGGRDVWSRRRELGTDEEEGIVVSVSCLSIRTLAAAWNIGKMGVL